MGQLPLFNLGCVKRDRAAATGAGPRLDDMSRMAQIVALRGARNGAVSDAAKLRGGYYTPDRVAKFLAQWAIHDSDAQVLEPSCGDGEVVAAAAKRLGKKGHVTGIELFEEEAAKAALRGGSNA